MKKCRRCSKPATLHITELRDGEVQALHLCESCAQDYLTTVEVGGQMELPEDALQKSLAAASAEDLEALDGLDCPNCGMTFKEFRGQGRLGCPHDYVVFQDELNPLLESIHGATQHAGKFPRRAPAESRKQYELIKLRNELRTAVDSEEYEAAARIRDEIHSLETSAQEASDE